MVKGAYFDVVSMNQSTYLNYITNTGRTFFTGRRNKRFIVNGKYKKEFKINVQYYDETINQLAVKGIFCITIITWQVRNIRNILPLKP